MKKELRFTFQTGQLDVYGFRNDLDIYVDYYPESGNVELLTAASYNTRKAVFTDLTYIFKSQLFQSVINGIDWQELYNKQLIDDANERINIPYDVMMVSNALTQ